MDKKKYYKNKIMYALQKIDYALARMRNKKPDNILSKVYFVLENYNEIDFLTLTRVFKDIKKEKIRKAVKYLADLGVLEWEGKRLTDNKTVSLEVKDYASFIREVGENVKKSKSKIKLNLKDIQEIFEYADNKAEKNRAQDKNKDKTIVDWVEVRYNDSVILKVKKSKLKKLLD